MKMVFSSGYWNLESAKTPNFSIINDTNRHLKSCLAVTTKFNFFPSRSESKTLQQWRKIRLRTNISQALVQTSDIMNAPKLAIDDELSRDSKFFSGIYRLDFFHQILNQELETFTVLFYQKTSQLLLWLKFLITPKFKIFRFILTYLQIQARL